jgi:hypothetical protein
MSVRNPLLVLCCCWAWLLSSALADPVDGLVAEWNFDEGDGAVARDASGNGHDATIQGASWVAKNEDTQSPAIHLDGVDDYIDCGPAQALGIAGPITVEAWVRPMAKGHGEASLIGAGMQSFLLTYYNAELCYFYIGRGGNCVSGALDLGKWNHVVGAFDGTMLSMWINGRLVGTRESAIKQYDPAASLFHIGTPGRPDLAKYKGMVDRVRVYNRALTADEAVGHFKEEAAQYGFDPTWFTRVKVTPYYYFERGELVVEAN